MTYPSGAAVGMDDVRLALLLNAVPPAICGVLVRGGLFRYVEDVELLTAAGAEVFSVDPLRDEALPAGVTGLVISGGSPDVYAVELSATETLRDGVAAPAARWAPIAAEFAGLLHIAREPDGVIMCGLLDVATAMSPRLALGYREAVDSVLAAAGTRVRGHEFHRTHATPATGASGQVTVPVSA